MKHLEVLRVAFPFFFFFHLIDWLRERGQVQAACVSGGGEAEVERISDSPLSVEPLQNSIP